MTNDVSSKEELKQELIKDKIQFELGEKLKDGRGE